MAQSEDHGLTWKERLAVMFTRKDTTLNQVVAEARSRGLRMARSTASDVWRGHMPPNDRFVAAVSIVLDVHPADLGFERTAETELGFRAYEWAHPEDRRHPRPSQLLKATA